MNCPRCGNPIAVHATHCDSCGADIAAYRKMYRLSNRYYNDGLEKASVRDLTGAITSLKKSLEFNKFNSDARNLLGLVYYEMGEVVAGLTEWVVSKNLQKDDNEADYFIEKVQSDPTELDAVDQSVHKYNLALAAAKEGHKDTAVIQLKKAVSQYSNNLKALQLLALIYITDGEYSKARKILLRAIKIDAANTTTLRYMSEIGLSLKPMEPNDTPESWEDALKEQVNPGKGIAFVTSYREDKPNVMVFVNLILGVIIGIVVVYFLIVPTIKTNLREDYENKRVDYSEELSSKTATITKQDTTIKSLEEKVDKLTYDLNNIEPEVIEVPIYSDTYGAFFDILKEYNDLKDHEYTDEELVAFAVDLFEMDPTGIENSYAKKVLSDMRAEMYSSSARKTYRAGKNSYDAGDYPEAIRLLEAAVEFDSSSDSALYYLGKSYQAAGRYEEALSCYTDMLNRFPDSTLKEYLPTRINECNEAMQQNQ